MEPLGKTRYKLAVMGGGGVGKSCLTVRMLQNTYMDNYDPTIEDFYLKDNFLVDEESTNIEILDTAGQDNVIGTRDQYYRASHAFLLVYSVSDELSLKDVEERINGLMWARNIQEGEQLPPIIIVGNKCDLPAVQPSDSSQGEVRKVTREEGEQLAQRYKVLFEETSAKANINVHKIFQDVLRELLAREKKEKGKLAEKGKSKGKKVKENKEKEKKEDKEKSNCTLM